MKKAFDDYTWLAGRAGTRGSLWQGPDHLLVVEGKGFVFPYREVYRRIDYKNIQALMLTRTMRFVWLGVLYVLLLGLLLAGWLMQISNNGWTAFTTVPLSLGYSVKSDFTFSTLFPVL